jgi:glycosyltransferase involved in cell wall biosynthesis
MVTFSQYPDDPRPRRAAGALLKEGMTVDLICLADERSARRESSGALDILRIPIAHRRGGKLAYASTYSAFILASAAILALRSLKRRYDVVHIHNMPDVLVASALAPKWMGAKVILDLHDPMPELMMSIYGFREDHVAVRLLRWLEKWSIARAHRVLTVNIACHRIFAGRSCDSAKVGVVMNSPDEQLFPLRRPHSYFAPKTRERFVMMYHGSLVERNGLDLAVTALARVRKAVPCAELRVFGRTTPFLEQVMTDVRAKGLEGSVHALGPRRLEDLKREIEQCDVGVIPNQKNPFTGINTPTRIFEYLALGKPVIAPRTPGIEDYFDPGSLFFFEPGNAEDLAETMEYVYAHPAEALEIAVRGQQTYLAHTWSEERRKLVNLVAELLRREKAA